jgi:hypothetical protein
MKHVCTIKDLKSVLLLRQEHARAVAVDIDALKVVEISLNR